MPLLLFGPLGGTEILLILGLALLIFGGSKIPALGRGLGEGIRNFKESVSGKDEKKLDEPKESSES